MALKVALVHDWLVSQRGGEAVLETLVELFPSAPIYTLVVDRTRISKKLSGRDIRPSFLQTLPGAGPEGFRKFLPLFPSAVAGWDFDGFDLIVSTSHCVAKAAGARQNIPHISYVHTPMRYIWDQWEHYAPSSPLLRTAATPVRVALQRWDSASSQRSGLRLLANSNFVAQRIKRVWKRESHVVYPPVDTDFFFATAEQERSYWCVVSALVPYKRVGLAVEWANRFERPLIVVGEGPEQKQLERLAGPTVQLKGRVSRQEIRDVFAGALGLIFPGVEDFGIVPLEAMASGVPVLAFGEGGALETVSIEAPRETGALFDEFKADSIEEAAVRITKGWEEGKFTRDALRTCAAQFSIQRFEDQLRCAIQDELESLGFDKNMI